VLELLFPPRFDEIQQANTVCLDWIQVFRVWPEVLHAEAVEPSNSDRSRELPNLIVALYRVTGEHREHSAVQLYQVLDAGR
jgi:hypothetical protein